jgi:hypothetical protein
MDTVADRDVFIEFAQACALVGVHFSRMAEDLILWSSAEFKFIELPDAFCTGSSLMPQKKNPDSCELLRGKSARLQGNLHTLRRRRASVVKRLTAELCPAVKNSLQALRKPVVLFLSRIRVTHCMWAGCRAVGRASARLFGLCGSGFSLTPDNLVASAASPRKFTEKMPSQLRIS